MSRSIKVSEDVYQGLRVYQGPREGYSDVIEHLLTIRRALDDLKPLITGAARYQAERIEKEVEK